jgi:hypothetical protein
VIPHPDNEAKGAARPGRLVRLTEAVATGAVATLMGGLGVAGAVVSYATVAEAMRPGFGALAPLVPLGIDAGILAVTGMDLLQARHHHRSKWMRFVPMALVGLTSWLNASAAHSVLGAVTHAALPGLWVLAVEGAGHSIRHYAGLTAPKQEAMDGIRLSRWLYAPIQTAKLARRRSLWEITDYGEALERDRNRRLARCDLQERYGTVAWRWKSEARRDRVAYHLGALHPRITKPAETLDMTASTPASSGPAPVPRPAPPLAPAASPAKRRPASVDDLLPIARHAAAELSAEGETLRRSTLKPKMQALGHPVGSNPKLDALIANLRTEPPATPAANHPSAPRDTKEREAPAVSPTANVVPPSNGQPPTAAGRAAGNGSGGRTRSQLAAYAVDPARAPGPDQPHLPGLPERTR